MEKIVLKLTDKSKNKRQSLIQACAFLLCTLPYLINGIDNRESSFFLWTFLLLFLVFLSQAAWIIFSKDKYVVFGSEGITWKSGETVKRNINWSDIKFLSVEILSFNIRLISEETIKINLSSLPYQHVHSVKEEVAGLARSLGIPAR